MFCDQMRFAARSPMQHIRPVNGNSTPPITTLHRAGAHWVLAKGKRPYWAGWQRRIPSVQDVIEHVRIGGDVGIVPWSLRETVFDVDHGNPDGLLKEIGVPRVVLDSLSRENSHHWFDDTEARANSTFEIGGCRGDIRSGKGFVIVPPDQLDRLLEGLFKSGRFQVQEDIFDTIAENNSRKESVAGAYGRPDSMPLESCRIGHRNQSLFDAVRHRVYPLKRGDNRNDWHKFVLEIALDMNSQLPDPLPVAEVKDTAYSIAGWTWNRDGHLEPLDHSFQAQSRRGIKRYYGDAGYARQRAIRERNGLICDLRSIGWKQRDIAERVGVVQATVSRVILKADGHGFPVVDRETATDAEPWREQGISRATWYARGKPMGIDTDMKPWEKEGISRAWWYRKGNRNGSE